MTVNLPAELSELVKSMIMSGAFSSEGEVIAEGVRLVACREKLRRELKEGIDQLDSGNMVAAEDVYNEVEAEISGMEARDNRG